MSQPKYPVLKVRNKNPGNCSTGANTDVTIDGKHIPMVSFIKVEIKARNVAKVTMEMYADIDMELEPGNATLSVKKVSGWLNILGFLDKTFLK